MIDTSKDKYYEGKFLIASPTMSDFRFNKVVIFLCSHSSKGSMGIIINKPAFEIKFKDLLKQLKISHNTKVSFPHVYFGGPVENGRGFVLHSNDYYTDSSSIIIKNNLHLTATLDILEDIAKGKGPQKCLLTLGCSGWGPGQLEKELNTNSWIVADYSEEIIFECDDSEKWNKAFARLGVNPSKLSPFSGSA